MDFLESVWQRARLLLIGTILVPGRRTVASVLRVMGLSNERPLAVQLEFVRCAADVPVGDAGRQPISKKPKKLLLGPANHSMCVAPKRSM